MRPQLLFGAIMSITTAFSVGDQITALAGYPTQDYVAHTMALHMQDYGGTRMEMGYACAVATLLFLLMVDVYKRQICPQAHIVRRVLKLNPRFPSRLKRLQGERRRGFAAVSARF